MQDVQRVAAKETSTLPDTFAVAAPSDRELFGIAFCVSVVLSSSNRSASRFVSVLEGTVSLQEV